MHRFVISIHSGYFKRLCEGGFQEATERKVTLHDDPPFAVKLMVDWFYSFDYKLLTIEKHISVLEAHYSMLRLADKCDIPSLKDLVVARVRRFLARISSQEPSDIICQSLLAGTLHAFKNATPVDDRFCKVVIEGWVANDKQILRHSDKEDLEAAMADVPEFASALIAQLGGFALKTKEQSEDSGAMA